MSKLFISHASGDKKFAVRLAEDLRQLHHKVWLDEWELRVGDSIISEISHGIEDADSVVLILSKRSVQSKWVEREWQTKYWQEITEKHIRVLPVLLETCNTPILLNHKMYADFRGPSKYPTGLVHLADALRPVADASGLSHLYSDFVDIDRWPDFFQASASLDLLVMYAASWRNTYLKHIRALLKKPKARLRVILPDVTSSSLLEVYAPRLRLEPRELRNRIEQAIEDFSGLAKYGIVEVYSSPKYFNHAMYLFDTRCVFALYSFSPNRNATPAFVTDDGWFTTFMREDFDYLISNDADTRTLFRTKNRKL